MGWLLLVLSIALAFLHSLWWWGLAALLAVWRVQQWYFYNGRPWRKIHYALMRAYAGEAGAETVAANREGRSFEVRRAATALVARVKPHWSDARVRTFVDEQIRRCESFEDETLILDEFRRRNPKLGAAEVTEASALARQLLIPPDNRTVIQLIVAALVEEQHGSPHRAEYLVEVLNGKAN